MGGNRNKIVVFAPDIEGREDVSIALRDNNYDVVEVLTLPWLLNAFGKNDFDLAIFGVSPGQENITDLSATIRSICRVPVLFLISADVSSDFLDQVKSCADDFILYPLRPEELILRADLVLSCHSRREEVGQRDKFPVGNMIFDFKNQALHTSSGIINLTKTEAQLLHLLCLYRNNILPRELALETIWGESDYFKSRSMDVYVAKLRKLIKVDKSVTITNIHKVGFRLEINKNSDAKQS